MTIIKEFPDDAIFFIILLCISIVMMIISLILFCIGVVYKISVGVNAFCGKYNTSIQFEENV